VIRWQSVRVPDSHSGLVAAIEASFTDEERAEEGRRVAELVRNRPPMTAQGRERLRFLAYLVDRPTMMRPTICTSRRPNSGRRLTTRRAARRAHALRAPPTRPRLASRLRVAETAT